MKPILTFDIETVPDVSMIRKVHAVSNDVSDHDVAEFAMAKRRAKTGSDFLPLHLHRVIAISCALREGDQFRIWSLGNAGDPERELLQRFYDGIDRYTPQLVSWNGSGFDLPVLHYRGLHQGVAATQYWDWGDDTREFRYNNYLNRYHTRHLDLMDILALYNPRGYASLDDIAKTVGLPGKLGMDGAQVWSAFLNGQIDSIRNYCETDVANTYLVFLHFQKMRGVLDEQSFQREIDLVRATLARSFSPHWREFLSAWPA